MPAVYASCEAGSYVHGQEREDARRIRPETVSRAGPPRAECRPEDLSPPLSQSLPVRALCMNANEPNESWALQPTHTRVPLFVRCATKVNGHMLHRTILHGRRSKG